MRTPESFAIAFAASATSRGVMRFAGSFARPRAAEHEPRIAVQRVHRVETGRPALLLLKAGDLRPRRTREPRWCGTLREQRDDDRICAAELSGTNGAELHRATSFR